MDVVEVIEKWIFFPQLNVVCAQYTESSDLFLCAVYKHEKGILSLKGQVIHF